jgi:hypothetical protein
VPGGVHVQLGDAFARRAAGCVRAARPSLASLGPAKVADVCFASPASASRSPRMRSRCRSP